MSEVTQSVQPGVKETVTISSWGEEEMQAQMTSSDSDRTWRNSLNLCQGRFRLYIKKRFFTQRVAGHWNRLPREVIMAPSLTEFWKCLDSALRGMVWLEYGAAQDVDLDSMILVIPFQFSLFCDSLIL